MFRLRQVYAIAAHRIVDFQAVLLPHHEVVLAVSGSGVNRTGTGLGGDVISQDHRHLALQVTVLQHLLIQICALAAAQYFQLFQAVTTGTVPGQFLVQMGMAISPG